MKYRPFRLTSGAPKPRRAQGRCLSCQTRLRRLADPLAQVTSTNWLVLPKEPLPKLLGPERDCRSRPQTWQEASLQPGRRYTPFHASGVAGTGIWTVAKKWERRQQPCDRKSASGRVAAGGKHVRHGEWSHSVSRRPVSKSSVCLGTHCAPKQPEDFLSLAEPNALTRKPHFEPEDDHAAWDSRLEPEACGVPLRAATCPSVQQNPAAPQHFATVHMPPGGHQRGMKS